MRHLNMTQADLCRSTKINAALISNYLAGKKTPSLSQIDRIAAALATTTARLLAGGDDELASHHSEALRHAVAALATTEEQLARSRAENEELRDRVAQVQAIPSEVMQSVRRIVELGPPDLLPRLASRPSATMKAIYFILGEAPTGAGAAGADKKTRTD